MEHRRNFKLGFDDYYDIYIWNNDPDDDWQILHGMVTEVSPRITTLPILNSDD